MSLHKETKISVLGSPLYKRKLVGKSSTNKNGYGKKTLICSFVFNSLQYFGLESLKGTLNHTSQPANQVLIKTALTLMDWKGEI